MIKSCKNLLLTLLIALSFTSLMKAQDKEKVETGKIYFLRATGWGGTFSRFKFFIDGKFVCNAKYKKYSVYEVPIGRHELSVKYGSKTLKTLKGEAEKIEFQAESGKAIYFELEYKVGVFLTDVYFKEIDENTAKEKMKQMEENTECL